VQRPHLKRIQLKNLKNEESKVASQLEITNRLNPLFRSLFSYPIIASLIFIKLPVMRG